MAHIVEPFQITIGGRPESSVSSYSDPYNNYDYALGGVPFLSAIDNEHPMTRSSAEFKRQQIDQSNEPGEQSLTGWWLRSQSSFHFGSGLKYEDPAIDDTAATRFNDSEGIDCWTEGQVTMLKETNLLKASGSTGIQRVMSGTHAGVDYYFRVDDDELYRGDVAGSETLVQTTAEPIQDCTTSGQYVYLSTSLKIYQVPMDGTGGVVKWSWTPAGTSVIGWNKERMMLGLDNAVYELSLGSAVLPTALYTHPDSAWRWTDFDEGPVAIYASGYNGSASKILKFALDLTGVLPVLQGGEVVADLPTGEYINVMFGYLGAFLTLGTSAGVRVAALSDTGALEYGPLIETPNPVHALCAKGSHMLAEYNGGFSDGGSGLIRIELQTLLPNGLYAFAPDLQTHAVGSITSACLFGSSQRMLMCVNDVGVYIESATDLESTGFLRTARIRYNMTWPKLFKQFSIDATVNGTMTVSAIDASEVETVIASMNINSDLRDDFQINYPDSPQAFMSLRFAFTRSATDATMGPTFRSYQLKSLPAGPRPRSFIIPFLCNDKETTKDGKKMGHPGYAVERLELVEALDSAGQVVLFEDLVNNRSWVVTIEQIEFRQIVPPARNREQWGGILTVSLRTIA